MRYGIRKIPKNRYHAKIADHHMANAKMTKNQPTNNLYEESRSCQKVFKVLPQAPANDIGAAKTSVFFELVMLSPFFEKTT